MCGLVGIADISLSPERANSSLQQMMAVLEHRGPDGGGTFNALDCGIYLGHRRLAIIDPEHGKQPMTSEDGQVTVVFNGAIYNYLELRRELIGKGHPIRSYSDTEALLYAYREWGGPLRRPFPGHVRFCHL
jgi:asparagine synthase (glutamine-hydrolysing)